MYHCIIATKAQNGNEKNKPLFIGRCLPSPVPFLRNQHANPDDNAGLLVPVWLVRGKPVIPDGAVGNPNLFLCEMVVHRRNGAEVVMLFAPLKMDDLSFLLCHSLCFSSKDRKR